MTENAMAASKGSINAEDEVGKSDDVM